VIKKTLVATTSLALVTLAVACAPPPPKQVVGGSTTTVKPSGPTTTKPSGATTTTTTTSTTTTLPQPTTTLPDTKVLYRSTPITSWGVDHPTQAETVDAVEIAGSAAYIGGTFSNARLGALRTPRANLMAVDLATGNLLPFVADTNGAVRAIASDGTSLYIGGDFTTVNGAARSRIAKLNLITGAVDPSFNASTGNTVHDMVVIGGRLYLVGAFNSVDGVARTRVAAVNTTNGGIDPDFIPTFAMAPGALFAIAANADGTRLYIGGATPGTVNDGVLREVDPLTGADVGPPSGFDRVNDKVEDLDISRDGNHVYAGTQFNSAVDWDPTNGNRTILQRAEGDVQAVQYSNGYLYIGFHDGFVWPPGSGQINTTLRLLALDPDNGYAVVDSFMPVSNGYPGVFTLDANGSYLVAGGWFATMGGVAVNGVAIFPRS
jgi:hypothetical protein